MEEYVKLLKLTIGDVTKTFLVETNLVTRKEIEGLYMGHCEEYEKKVTMEEFEDALMEYGISLNDISDHLITKIIL